MIPSGAGRCASVMPTRRFRASIACQAFSIRALSVLLAGAALAVSGCGMSNGYVANHLGASAYKHGQYQEARRYFRMAAIDHPQNADYVHNLAAATLKEGDATGAETLFRQALDVDPMHQPSYHSLASLMKDQGRLDDAGGLLAMWAETQPYKPEPQIELAWLNRETGNHAGAEQHLRQALQIQPNNSTALAHLGQVYQDQGRSGEALAMYQRSLFQNPTQSGVRTRVAGLRSGQTAPVAHSTVIAQQPAEWQSPLVMHSGTTVAQGPVFQSPVIDHETGMHPMADAAHDDIHSHGNPTLSLTAVPDHRSGNPPYDEPLRFADQTVNEFAAPEVEAH